MLIKNEYILLSLVCLFTPFFPKNIIFYFNRHPSPYQITGNSIIISFIR